MPTRQSFPDIYFVRDSEAERAAISSKDLVARIGPHGRQAITSRLFPKSFLI